MGMVR